ncbi:MAG TPA: hypothetical protein PKE57_00915 [Cellvibrionaceae bacterium]|nr:hypothetical protein [Cellvibrionaceae bacterium]HMW47637.1 hypothetical protein [Cellvibrionaceae bacterium]HMW72261.1 hypothetical protein [Cellvibrionaceae bacterium]HNG59692.1 hypothetical protein [Cellvibrionaceae bacterium]
MKYFAAFIILSIFSAGCATVPHQPTISFDSNTFKKGEKIGVYISPTPKITTQFPGANCLLCLGVAAAAHSGLTKQVESFKAESLGKVPDVVNNYLKGKGIEVVKINEMIKKLPKVKPSSGSTLAQNYGPYKTQYGIDRLLVINYQRVGVDRPYSAYVPTAVPHAVITAEFYIVDLATNSYSAYSPISITKEPDGSWDVAPKYPAITNAFYQAEEQASDLLTKPFK